ncbi:hypothetical protein HYW17_01660 [Candidatus Uhrbacteria bacterium]|nr:hypothetical protein [Candidatus Uhrbacteria bacterium]
MSGHLEQEILEVLVYFDLFSYPLTTLEIWRSIGGAAQYSEVARLLLESERLKARLVFQDGVWSLRSPLCGGAPPQSGERARRYRASKYKLDKARRFARLALRIPFVRAIYACNSLGFLNARSESDIDLFITIRRGRIWSARFFLILLAKCFGRPTSAHAKDGLCLSFFAAEGAQMRRAALPGGGDVYFEYWLKNLLPLTHPHPAFGHPLPRGSKTGRASAGPGEGRVRGKRSGGGDILEKLLRWVQMNIMPAHLREMANKGKGVVMNEEFLKFHDHDKREYFKKEYAARLAAVGL